MTKIILLSDVPHLGHKGDVKSVALGFAKNWLIRKQFAALATPFIIAKAQERKTAIARKNSEDETQYDSLLKELGGFTLRLRPKKNKQGTLYEGIDAKVIAQKLHDKNINLKSEVIKLEKSIKQVGEYEVPVVFSKDSQVSIKVIVQ